MLCLLLKALLVLHCKLALYYVQQSGAASQRSVQTCLPRARACVVTRAEGCGLGSLHVASIWVWGIIFLRLSSFFLHRRTSHHLNPIHRALGYG